MANDASDDNALDKAGADGRAVPTGPEPAGSVPEPEVSVPGPEASVPEPAVPVSEPEASIPEPTVPVSEPVVPEPEPVVPEASPAAAVPEPVMPESGPAMFVPEPAPPQPEPAMSVADLPGAKIEPGPLPPPVSVGPKTGSPWWAKALVGFGAILMIVAGGGAVYGKILLNRIEDAGTEKNLLGGGDSRAGEDIDGPLNLLMIGTDMRVNDTDDVDRADSIMILHINKDLSKANIISIPRDLKVPCNGEPEGTCYTKINGTYADGGDTQEERFQGLAEALGKLTGIKEFDGAAIIGFEGFLKAVKVLGSVELCLPMDMQLHHQMKEQPNKPRTFKKGCNEYNQREALWIVRERYAYTAETPGFDPDYGVGDYGRQHMQQHFIKQLLKKASEEGYITDPTKVGDLIETVGSSLTYHFLGHTPVDMAWALKGVKPDSMKTVRLPSTSSMEFGESFEVIPEGEPTEITEDLFKALREDTMDTWMSNNPKLINKD